MYQISLKPRPTIDHWSMLPKTSLVMCYLCGLPLQVKTHRPPDPIFATFHFYSENLPERNAFFARGEFWHPLGIDLSKVLTPNMKGRMRIQDEDPSTAFVRPDNIGSIYPFKQAIKRLDCPYYLGEEEVTLMGVKLNGLSVIVVLLDLLDTLKLTEQTSRVKSQQLMEKLSSGK